jgi:Tol biopolymer transport system component
MALVTTLLVPAPLTNAQSNPNLSNANLLANGDFEAGNTHPADWNLCGGAKLADAQNGATDKMVRGGRYALRLGQPIDTSCGNDPLGPSQVAFEDVTIPSDAEDVTLSFWYSALGYWAAGEIVIELTRTPRSYLGSGVLIDAIKMEDLQAGWHFYRGNLRSSDVAALRGQTVYLSVYVRFQGQPSWDWAMYLDDVRLSPTRERTQAAPLPADLVGNGTRPIVLDGPNKGVYRIDTDGGNRIRLATAPLDTFLPTWSPDGRYITFQTNWLEPENNTDTTKFPALIGRAWLMNADGSGLRPIFHTPGREGTKDSPPGCIRTNTCSDRGLDALDGLLTDLHWSPDSRHIAATVCIRGRWYNGDKDTQDASCHVSLYDVAGGNTVPIIGFSKWITEAQGASWSDSGKVLFYTTPSLASRKYGVWELDLSAQPSQTTQLLTWLTQDAESNVLDLRSNPESDPTWSPDGRYFITYRKSQSVHFVPSTEPDPFFSTLRTNFSIMLHDRQNLSQPRMLLLTDHGQLSGRPAWSPNGKYILYTLVTDEGTSADIWWLNVQTGETGKLTNDGQSRNADWLRTAQLPTEPTPIPTMPTPTPNPDLTFKSFLPLAVRSTGNTQPTPTSTPSNQAAVTPVVLPTLTPTTAPTALPTPANPTAVPPRGISGRVLYKGAPVGGIKLELITCLLDLPCTIYMTATTTSTGVYAFEYAPENTLLGYTVRYTNGPSGGNTEDPRYLLYWQTNGGLMHEYAERKVLADFDIAEVELTAPANNATVAVPATFSWRGRGGSDKYQWFIDALGDAFGLCDQQQPGTNTSFTFASLGCGGIFEIETNTPHNWRVVVTREGAGGGRGQSHVRTVRFAP